MSFDTPLCVYFSAALYKMFHMTLMAIHEPMTRRIPEWSLSDRLRKSREETGMNQWDFADHSGISRTSVVNYESGKRTPKGLYLRAWAEATGVDLHWIETGHEKTPADSSTGVCDLCALTGSNRGPADYGSEFDTNIESILVNCGSSVPDYVPGWMRAEVMGCDKI